MGLKLNLINFWFSIGIGFEHAWTYVSLSRALLILCSVQLITMPFTQYLWTWDHFLHGGRDFETGALMIVMFVCFVLLRAQNAREEQELLLACVWSSAVFLWHRERRRICRGANLPAFRPASETPLPPGALPLLI